MPWLVRVALASLAFALGLWTSLAAYFGPWASPTAAAGLALCGTGAVIAMLRAQTVAPARPDSKPDRRSHRRTAAPRDPQTEEAPMMKPSRLVPFRRLASPISGRVRLAFAIALAFAIVSSGASLPACAEPPPAEWGPLELLERTVPPGEKLKFSYTRSRTFEGAFLDTIVFAARGRRPGPTLCLTAMVHGDERNGFEVAREVFAGTDAKQLVGTLLALPAVNMNGFRTGSRYMPDRRDLNREFPGSETGSNSSIIAGILYRTATQYCDALVDLHTGSFDRANLPQIRVDLAHPQALELAKSFGAPVVLGGEGPRGSLRREMMEAGIPAIIYEAGLPLRFEPAEIEKGVEGVRNVMIHMGMVAGRPTAKTPNARVYAASQWQRVPLGEGGIFYPMKQLGENVSAGDEVAYVADPFTDRRFVLRAKRAGTVIGMAVPQVVFSGYALVHIAGN